MTVEQSVTDKEQAAKNAEWDRHNEAARKLEVAEMMAAEHRKMISECQGTPAEYYAKATPRQARRMALRKYRVWP